MDDICLRSHRSAPDSRTNSRTNSSAVTRPIQDAGVQQTGRQGSARRSALATSIAGTGTSAASRFHGAEPHSHCLVLRRGQVWRSDDVAIEVLENRPIAGSDRWVVRVASSDGAVPSALPADYIVLKYTLQIS